MTEDMVKNLTNEKKFLWLVADYKTIKFFNNKSLVDGFTTNPSLMRLAGVKITKIILLKF